MMDRDDIIGSLASAPSVVQRLVHGLTPAELRAGHDADNWSINEVLVHLRDADEISLERFTRMAREDRPLLPAYDQAVYAVERGYQSADAMAALADFVAIRGRMVDLFNSLADAGLDRPGVHEETGDITIRSLAAHVIAHDMMHFGQIARALMTG